MKVKKQKALVHCTSDAAMFYHEASRLLLLNLCLPRDLSWHFFPAGAPALLGAT
jgi:hypothetical protein